MRTGEGEGEGEALIHVLERRFVTAREKVETDSRTYDVLHPRDPDSLISEDEFEMDGRLPYWADIWPSSLILATRVKMDVGRGQRLLELGCGIGIVAIAAMTAGYEVLATDYYADALLFTRANAWRALGREPVTRLVDWRRMPPDLGVFDAVVAADVLYESENAALVAEALARTVSPGGKALIADPGRVATAEFLDQCALRKLELQACEKFPFTSGKVKQTIAVYEMKRVPGAGFRVRGARLKAAP